MAMISNSVTAVTEPLADAADLDARLAALRARFPRAIVDRYLRALPTFGARVVLSAGAALAGDVRLGDDVSIWYGAVLRGDLASVTVGARANIQDGTVVHVADGGPCEVGEETVVGHRAMLHACRIEAGCLIGMQATILDGAVIGHGSVVGAGALVTQRTVIPPHSLVLGAPGRVVKTLKEEDETFHRAMAQKYVRLKENYRCDAFRSDIREP
ncbi:MAG TPA: gamma carbonic anhydrase family protein [Polyangia bacterium]|jgi:carbonic anhydrase/acetyltransferase-like protein (isoleucine patch superfamily)|nr:gamma carbonic anhydrase family protein [Polyangia bacterium]